MFHRRQYAYHKICVYVVIPDGQKIYPLTEIVTHNYLNMTKNSHAKKQESKIIIVYRRRQAYDRARNAACWIVYLKERTYKQSTTVELTFIFQKTGCLVSSVCHVVSGRMFREGDTYIYRCSCNIHVTRGRYFHVLYCNYTYMRFFPIIQR